MTRMTRGGRESATYSATQLGTAILAVLQLTACGGPMHPVESLAGREAEIANGRETERFPYVGFLRSTEFLECSATLIRGRFAITSASCAAAAEFFDIEGKVYDVSGFYPHPQYTGGRSDAAVSNDIALIELASRVPVRRAGILSAAPKLGETVQLVGYGSTGDSAYDQGAKRHAKNKVAVRSRQLLKFSQGDRFGRGGACQEDGGSAVLARGADHRWQLAAVTISQRYRYDKQDCGRGTETRAVRVDQHRSWLQQTVNQVIAARSAAAVPFESVDEDRLYDGPSQATTKVIANAADWEAFYGVLTRHTSPPPPAPKVDFSQKKVIAVCLGAQPSSDYYVTIEDMRQVPAAGLVLTYRVDTPGFCGMFATVTYPCHLVVVDPLVATDKTLLVSHQRAACQGDRLRQPRTSAKGSGG